MAVTDTLRDLVDSADLLLYWVAEEGGRLQQQMPQQPPQFAYVRVRLPMATVAQARGSLLAAADFLFTAKACTFLAMAAGTAGVELALNHGSAGWVEACGRWQRDAFIQGDYFGYYGAPTKAWAEAFDERERRRREDRDAAKKLENL